MLKLPRTRDILPDPDPSRLAALWAEADLEMAARIAAELQQLAMQP
jgi:hypothetical protein